MRNKTRMGIKRIFFVFWCFELNCVCSFAQSDNILWYNKPAKYFEQALLLGNGKTGATVFGGIESDKIYLNDATFWSGGPLNLNASKSEVSSLIPDVRKALARGDYKMAEQINKRIEGKFSETYEPIGTLYIEYNHNGVATNYYRELDIGKAIAKVRYDIGGVTYTREYFVSNPDKIMIIKMSASERGALNFKVKFSSLMKYTISSNGKILQAHGYAPYYAYPDYMWDDPNPIRFDKNKGTRFTTDIKVKNKGGSVLLTDSTINVSNADNVILFVSVATSFNGFDKDPAKNGLNSKYIARNQLDNACKESYKRLKNRHIKDYQSFFNRMRLNFNGSTTPKLPTDKRLKDYAKGNIDNSLEALYLQYGRYLLISCSRTNGVPANLQGIWNPYNRPPWSCNYTMNINAEENYWLAECANLPEMHMPFLTFIEHLAITGKHTAKYYYGIDKGWASCHNSDIWATSNPVGEGKISPRSSCWNMGGTWAVTHLWEHYLYTGDKNFLKEKAYPLMKGAVEFCLAWMVKDHNGYYITSPSTSPEALYVTNDGFVGATMYGGTADLAMIRECLIQTIKASEMLNVDYEFRDSMKTALKELLPYRIGNKGNLQEWYYDWADQEPQHRHQSHLFGLYPGHQITPEKTPSLARAARRTLEIRGDEATGWSLGWRINLWARLNDGNHAYKMFRTLLKYVEPDASERIVYNGGGGTYPNLMDAHPPFQIDGNFGGAAGVLEMLLQSNDKEIYLLPALPDAWSSGSISGICARGGFEIKMEWKNSTLLKVKVLSKLGNRCILHYRGETYSFDTKKGKAYSFNYALKNYTCINKSGSVTYNN